MKLTTRIFMFLISILLLSCGATTNNETIITSDSTKENLSDSIDNLIYEVLPNEIPENIDSVNFYSFNVKKPDQTTALNLADSQFVTVEGFFHEAEILIESQRNGEKGFSVIKPFSYIRERNPSLGWPSWAALDAILVNVGWIPANTKHHDYRKMNFEDPIFRDQIKIRGILIQLNKNNQTSINPINILRKEYYDVYLLWELVNHQIRNSDIPPCGVNYLPVYIELISQ